MGFLSTLDRGSMEEESSFDRLRWIENRHAVVTRWTSLGQRWTHEAGQDMRRTCTGKPAQFQCPALFAPAALTLTASGRMKRNLPLPAGALQWMRTVII
jgi:hypothetical protein